MNPVLCGRLCPCWGYFLRAEVVRQVGYFDETLGPGAGTLWGSCEDLDYLLRAVKKGFRIYYRSDLVVHNVTEAKERELERAYNYAAGGAYVWRRHGRALWMTGLVVMSHALRLAAALAVGRWPGALYHWRYLLGHIHGLLS
jgi:GT2 family glycosyltransferase